MWAGVPRRSVLASVAAAGVAHVSLRALAQPKQRVYRVGVLSRDSPDPDEFGWREFVDELSRLGYKEGSSVAFERRSAEFFNAADVARAATELVQARVDVIYTQGGFHALAAKKATSTVPIVFRASPDPVGLGLVRNLSRPEANLTGSSLQAWETNARELQLFSLAIGKLTNMAYFVLGGASYAGSYAQAFASIVDTGRALGMRVRFVNYESVRDLDPMLEGLVREGVNGIGMLDSFHSDEYRRLAVRLIDLRLPSIGYAADGYLLSYGYSSAAISRVGAQQVDKILRGAKPADLPVEQVSTFELEINVRTAKAIGVSIPPSVLIQATRVIE